MYIAVLSFLLLFPLLGAAVYMTKKQEIVAEVTTISEFVVLSVLSLYFLFVSDPSGQVSVTVSDICGMGLEFVFDGFRVLYSTIASFMWLAATRFSRRYMEHFRKKTGYYFFLLVTLSATIGVFLSANWFTLYVFFEIMSLTSLVWVVWDEKASSIKAGNTYLAIGIIGGLTMLMGIFMLQKENLSDMEQFAAGICMLVGFGAKAGMFPLHVWLPKAHPAAPAPASALLSGILTKTGIFGILLITAEYFQSHFTWHQILLILGTVTMFIGAFLAVCSDNIKRTLACSSVSQIGFILVGIGTNGLLSEEFGIAHNGSILHMVNHSFLKLVLFLAAGIIYTNVHQLTFKEVQGFGRKKPFLKTIFLIGALTIAGFPGLSGYISKTMIHEGLVEAISHWSATGVYYELQMIEWLFLLSGSLTFLYMIRLYICIFVKSNVDKAKQQKFDNNKTYISKVERFLLTISCLPFFVIGLISVQYYTLENIKGAVISIGIGTVLLVLFRKKETFAFRWDLEDRIYRPLLWYLDIGFSIIFRICDRAVDTLIVIIRHTFYRDSKLPHELTEGTIGTHLLGSFADMVYNSYTKLHHIHKKQKSTIEHRLALIQREVGEYEDIIRRSMSFGLMLATFGLLLTLIYMLLPI